MNLSGLEEFEPRCKCPQCGSYNTETTYTKPRKKRRGHRCHDCQLPFQSAMLDVPENEPTAEVIREAIERVKSPMMDRKGYWTRIGSFVRISAVRTAGSIVAVYRCELCRKPEVLSRQQFTSRKLCACQAFDPESPSDQFRKTMGQSVSAAAKANGLAVHVVDARVRAGWNFERAISEPVRQMKKKGES